MEAFRGLRKQGFLGLYKGALMGIIAQGCRMQYSFAVVLPGIISSFNDNSLYSSSLMTYYSLALLGSTFVYPIEAMESRLILQNRIKEFSTIKNVFLKIGNIIGKNRISKDLGKGFLAIFPISVLSTLPSLTMLYYGSMNDYLMMASLLCGSMLSYPFVTIQRRLQCQSTEIGMIPLRYSGVLHGLKLIYLEEGIKGLYRGYLGMALFVGYCLTQQAALYTAQSTSLMRVVDKY